MHRRSLLIACSLSLLSACDSLKRKDQTSRLDSSLTAYAGAIRWGSFEAAQALSRPRSGAARALDATRLDGLKVTGYTVRINNVSETGDEANVSFSFTYYFLDSGRVKRVDQTDTWYFEPQAKAWFLDGYLPEFNR